MLRADYCPALLGFNSATDESRAVTPPQNPRLRARRRDRWGLPGTVIVTLALDASRCGRHGWTWAETWQELKDGARREGLQRIEPSFKRFIHGLWALNRGRKVA
jgi:hypothetical protein